MPNFNPDWIHAVHPEIGCSYKGQRTKCPICDTLLNPNHSTRLSYAYIYTFTTKSKRNPTWKKVHLSCLRSIYQRVEESVPLKLKAFRLKLLYETGKE